MEIPPLPEQPLPKPPKVKLAVRLLHLWLFLCAVKFLTEIARFDLVPTPKNPPGVLTMAVVGMIISFSVNSVIVYHIDRGANWARITFLVFRFIGIAGATLAIGLGLASLTFLLGLQLAAGIAAVILLFTHSANVWFRSSLRSSRSATV